ncbi:MAG TPA: DUF883 domain-containing protein [Noviherbaspirillum sp.]|nr:DUF883 domain-containing protein [Noviherbaspirillum sp.]
METISLGGDIRDRLLEDLRLVIKDAEDLLRTSGAQLDEGYRLARARFESTLSDARISLSTLEDGARDALDSTQQYVKENPWQAVGIGAVAGLAIGLMIGRR